MFNKFAKNSIAYRAINCNGISIRARVANTDAARAQGLSGVASIADDEGMLFDFGNDQYVTMWMKNCLTDLSVAFITKAGVIVDIQEMSKDTPTILHNSPIPVRYALEVNKGFFTRHNIALGDKVSI